MGMATDYDPWEHAARIGINIEHQSLRTANGLWLPEHRTIVLRSRMRRIQERSTLTHELAHVCLGHVDDSGRNEIRADRWAVRKLVAPGALEHVALLSVDPNDWCYALDVSPRILDRALADLRVA